MHMVNVFNLAALVDFESQLVNLSQTLDVEFYIHYSGFFLTMTNSVAAAATRQVGSRLCGNLVTSSHLK